MGTETDRLRGNVRALRVTRRTLSLDDDMSNAVPSGLANTAQWVGIAIGALVASVILVFLLYVCCRKCCCRSRSPDPEESTLETARPLVTRPSLVRKPISSMVGRNRVRKVESDGQDYFKQLAAKIKVQSISDYKK